MELIADILLLAGALGASFYCFVLSRRLRRFNDLENGVGAAIASLSKQVDGMSSSLKSAQTAARESTGSLRELTERADTTAKRLELLVASLHDLPFDADDPPDANAALAAQEAQGTDEEETAEPEGASETPEGQDDATTPVAIFSRSMGAAPQPAFRHQTEVASA